jgi:hypothetical protein
MVARDVRHQLPEPALHTVVVVVAVVATQARQVILQWLEAQAVRVVVETAEHLRGMPQHRHAPRAQVEMAMQTPVAAAVVEDIAPRVTVAVETAEQELSSFVMRFRKYQRQTLIPPTTLAR